MTLSRDARGRALQLPTWNEALSLPRPWDQQWSLRLQQVLAYETDLLEYPDLFEGSPVVDEGGRAREGARRGIRAVEEHGRRVEAIESGYMKAALVRATRAARRINSGDTVVVGRQPLRRRRAFAADRGTAASSASTETAAETLEMLAPPRLAEPGGDVTPPSASSAMPRLAKPCAAVDRMRPAPA